MCLKYGITWDCSKMTHRDYTHPSARRSVCCMFRISLFHLWKGFKSKVFLFHVCVFMGPIQVCAHAVCLVDHLIDLPNSALKVRVFARPEALQYLYLRHSLSEVSPKRWICLELVLLVFWPCLKYAIKSYIRTSILNLCFNNSVDWLKLKFSKESCLGTGKLDLTSVCESVEDIYINPRKISKDPAVRSADGKCSSRGPLLGVDHIPHTACIRMPPGAQLSWKPDSLLHKMLQSQSKPLLTAAFALLINISVLDNWESVTDWLSGWVPGNPLISLNPRSIRSA